jgi:hypothetical protein
MAPDAPALLIALETSGFGQAIRQSTWLYPGANVTHVVALAVFAGAVTVMDLRLLGAFQATPPGRVVRPAQRVAVIALLALAATGFLLFTAEASHVWSNPVFRVKAILVGLGIANALAVQRVLGRELDGTAANAPLPLRVRVAAAASLAIWLSVAAAGRLIAYF